MSVERTTDEMRNAPKRPANAYILWLKSNRHNIINDHFTSEGECTLNGREKVTKVGTKARELWLGMDEVSKKPFESKAADAKAEYETAILEYNAHLEPDIRLLTLKADVLEKQLIEETDAMEKAETQGGLANQQEIDMLKERERIQTSYAQAVEANSNSSEVLDVAKDKFGITKKVLADVREILRLKQLDEKRRLLKKAYDAQKEARRVAEQQQEALFLKQMAKLDAEEGDAQSSAPNHWSSRGGHKWCGPFDDTYILNLVKGEKKYTSFQEAVARAEELGAAKCGGITQDYDGPKEYGLRPPGPVRNQKTYPERKSVSWCTQENYEEYGTAEK